MKCSAKFLLATSIFWYVSSSAFAGGPGCADGYCDGCGPVMGSCAPQVQYQEVERTIYVPQVTMETRTIHVTQCRPETRERTVTVYKQVAETRTVTQRRTIAVPEQRTRTETYYVPRPVYKDVAQTYTVMVPHQERVSLTRTVCRPYPVKMQRTVTVDEGHWEEHAVAAAPACGSYGDCGGCGYGCNDCGGGCGDCAAQPQTVMKRVWVAKPVQRVEYKTVMQYRTEEVPYETTRTVCRPEQRERTVRVFAGCEQESHTREVTYTVCVPKEQVREVPVTTYRAVPTQQQQTYTVMVPYTVEKQIQVPVCRMVQKRVVSRVPVYAPAAECDSCCY